MGAAQSTGGPEGASSPGMFYTILFLFILMHRIPNSNSKCLSPITEQLSVVLAERFATKCFTPLELTHFKDNFYSRALDQAGFRYWNEKILSDFLGIPDGIYTDERGGNHDGRLDTGPVIFRMVSYLGAFPFQKTLAPSVLTFEAMVKVVVLLTERYGKVLRRGRKDRVKLLFGSLADVGRPPVRDTKDQELSESTNNNNEDEAQGSSSHAQGFSIDAPANDDYDEEEDDDDLALAALDSLDAIEVFKHDQRIDRAVYEARISVDTFRRLLMLLLVIAPLRPLESVTKYTYNLSPEEQASIKKEADSIISSFSEEELRDGIGYKSFSKTVSLSLPHLFDPLTPLFEHLLFSKNLDLSRKRTGSEINVESSPTLSNDDTSTAGHPAAIMLPGSFESAILTPSMVSHLSFFLPASLGQNIYRSDIHLHPVFSTVAHGESLTSFQHNVFTWQAPSLLIVQGARTGGSGSSNDDDLITLGAYIPRPWKPTSSSYATSTNTNNRSSLPYLFQLLPKHSVLPGNPSASSKPEQTPNPAVFFSTSTGIAIGCEVSASAHHKTTYGPGVPSSSSSRHLRNNSNNKQNAPIPNGAGSLIIDPGLETAQLHISYLANSSGTFTPAVPPILPNITHLDIYNLEIWGIIEPDLSLTSTSNSGNPAKDAVSQQRAAWQFDAREAERRKGLNVKLGANASENDYQNARALLEMAGIISDRGQRSGGSV
jgi:TLD